MNTPRLFAARSGTLNEYEVITDGQVVGRISLFSSSPAGTPWMWSIDFDFQEGRERTYGFKASCEAAMGFQSVEGKTEEGWGR